ncbi:hypothetical protein L083_1044 [Actinoplanes sp. N902-109]|nr:hypothetical protein L083_1044 [Actinoplanes sp. N902-109]
MARQRFGAAVATRRVPRGSMLHGELILQASVSSDTCLSAPWRWMMSARRRLLPAGLPVGCEVDQEAAREP